MRNQLRPLFDRIVIKELDPDRIRRSGLLVPPGSDEPPPQQGIVLAVGPGLDWWEHVGVKMPVQPGDHVVFPSSAGAWVEIDEERLLVCRVGELLGVLDQVEAMPGLRRARLGRGVLPGLRARGLVAPHARPAPAQAAALRADRPRGVARLDPRQQLGDLGVGAERERAPAGVDALRARSVRASACAYADHASGDSGSSWVAASAAETSAPTSPARW